MGSCFSVYQGAQALRSDRQESPAGYTAGLAVLGIALLADGASLLSAPCTRRAGSGTARPTRRCAR